MAQFEIIGAGMAGLLASHMLTKMGHDAWITERQAGIPNNHSAVLRFRSSVVADVTGIEFKPVKVMRTVMPWRNELADSLAYSRKATGLVALRSSVRENNGMVTRYIAPHDFIPRLSDMLEDASVTFNTDWVRPNLPSPIPAISTMPMPLLAKLLGYQGFIDAGIEFNSVRGYNLNFRIPGIDVYGTVYVPDPNIIWNRVSITGDRVTAEYSDTKPNTVNALLEALANDTSLELRMPRLAEYLFQATHVLGLDGIGLASMVENDFSVRRQPYQKIMPIDDNARKRFMLWASEHHNIYSLGRFATWRPGLLLDDLVQDIRRIERMANDGYFRRSIALKGI